MRVGGSFEGVVATELADLYSLRGVFDLGFKEAGAGYDAGMEKDRSRGIRDAHKRRGQRD
jgi:hypothetical protein